MAWSVERDVRGDDADADGRGARARSTVLERSHSPPLAAPPAAVPVTASRRAVVAIHSAPPPAGLVVCRRARAAGSDEGCDEVAFVEAGGVSSRRERRRGRVTHGFVSGRLQAPG